MAGGARRSSTAQSQRQTHAPPGRADPRPADSPGRPQGEPRAAPGDPSGTGVPGTQPSWRQTWPWGCNRAARARSSRSGGSQWLSGRREQWWVIKGDEGSARQGRPGTGHLNPLWLCQRANGHEGSGKLPLTDVHTPRSSRPLTAQDDARETHRCAYTHTHKHTSVHTHTRPFRMGAHKHTQTCTHPEQSPLGPVKVLHPEEKRKGSGPPSLLDVHCGAGRAPAVLGSRGPGVPGSSPAQPGAGFSLSRSPCLCSLDLSLSHK